MQSTGLAVLVVLGLQLCLGSASPTLPTLPPTARLLRLDTDIREVQQRWRSYRNIFLDGFFLNDSMLLLADYYSDEEEDLQDQFMIQSENTGSKVSLPGGGVNVENFKVDEWPHGQFEETLEGIISALSDIQSKGDLMMGAIRGQRQVSLLTFGFNHLPTTSYSMGSRRR